MMKKRGTAMTVRHMKVFLAVYQTENITRAAEMLYMTQPSVTRVIREIESYYGIQLFDRLNKRLSVTEAGRAFYGYALHIVDVFDRMEKEVRDWDEFGVIRVGASITLGNRLLPGALSAFRASHPGVRVQTQIANGASLQAALRDNRLDFALIEGGVHDELLSREVVAGDRLLPVLPPDDPRAGRSGLKLADFAQDSLLLREQGSAGRTLLERVFASHGLTLQPSMESVSTQAIIRCVHAGLGVSFLPEHLVRPDVDAGFVATAELEDERFERENYLVWHRQKYLCGSMKALMDLFRASAPDCCGSA